MHSFLCMHSVVAKHVLQLTAGMRLHFGSESTAVYTASACLQAAHANKTAACCLVCKMCYVLVREQSFTAETCSAAAGKCVFVSVCVCVY